MRGVQGFPKGRCEWSWESKGEETESRTGPPRETLVVEYPQPLEVRVVEAVTVVVR